MVKLDGILRKYAEPCPKIDSLEAAIMNISASSNTSHKVVGEDLIHILPFARRSMRGAFDLGHEVEIALMFLKLAN